MARAYAERGVDTSKRTAGRVHRLVHIGRNRYRRCNGTLLTRWSGLRCRCGARWVCL